MVTTTLKLDDEPEIPRRRHDDDVLDGAPWPIRAVAIFGASTCIALFCVWFLATTVAKGQDEIKQLVGPLSGHVQTSERLGATLEKLEQDHRDSNRRLERLLQVMCWQQARSDAQRSNCIDGR